MERIEEGGRLFAIVWRDGDWKSGLNFCTPDEIFIQAGCWQYPAGKNLGNHRHKTYPRTVTKTQELVYVKRGRLKTRILTDDGKAVTDFTLNAGDFAVMVDGGHGYEILEEDTQVLEVKNGPFIDVSIDKEQI
jgi:hypothetical protein